MKRQAICASVLLVMMSGTLAWAQAAGQRIVANWEQEPNYPPASLHYGTNNHRQTPVVYRAVWRFEQAPQSAGVRIDGEKNVFVWVNGRCVNDRAKNDKQPAKLPLELDLAPYLRAGDNVVAISAGNAGFALAGYADEKPLASRPEDWQVWKFPPVTILQNEPFMSAVAIDNLPSAKTKAVETGGIECSSAQAKQIVKNQLISRLNAHYELLAYDAQLLSSRGIAIVNDQAVGWAGTMSVPHAALEAAGKVSAGMDAVGTYLANVRESNPARDEALAMARKALAEAGETMDRARQMIVINNRITRYNLAAAYLGESKLGTQFDPAVLPAMKQLQELDAQLAAAEQRLQAKWGAPLNDLNSAVANKAGWIDDPGLVGSVPEAWGVRLNPVQTSWFMDLAGKWRFKLDADNTGLAERVHEFGYNIENQWPELNVPGYWEKQGESFQVNNPKALEQSPYPGVNARTDGPYNGFAWYRKKVLVPAEWAGYDLELFMETVDDYDWFYWNGEEIGHTGADTNPKNFWNVNRAYKIPKEKVTFGGYNVIAIRVYDCGAGGGIMGGIQLRCPALKQAFENKPAVVRKPTIVHSSPLSPAALLTVQEKELELFGWDFRGAAGPDGVVLNIAGGTQYRAFENGTVYDQSKDGPFSANWALLWAKPGRTDGDLPIQLVFLTQPKSIAVERGEAGTRRLTIDFGVAGTQVLALRPIRFDSTIAEATDARIAETCGFWSQAALAYPVNYFELAKLIDGRKDQLSVIDLFDYRELKDAWNTTPIKLAPLPPLASYGLAINARGVNVGEAVKALDLSLGEYGKLHAVVGSGSIAYFVPVDTLPRLGGYTAFCFGPDVGVPGNHKELEIMAATGANTWRPQSNNRDERIFKTIKWANDWAMNLTLNIDNNLGIKPDAITFWETIARHCKDMEQWQVAYDLINEPANMTPEVYNPQIKKIVEAIRKIDRTHMVLVETPHSFASIDQFVNLAPVDDKAVVYTFHDYDYRLPPRWPKLDTDIRNIQHQWLPAFRYSLKYDAPICISEYGGFEQGNDPYDPDALVLLADFFKVFDQFGFHHQYYSNRGISNIRPDGSVAMSMVHEGYRRLFAGDTFYRFRDNWQQQVIEKRTAGSIIDWQFAGPFTKDGVDGLNLLDEAFAPETSAEVKWQPMPISHYPAKAWDLDLTQSAARGDNRAAYLRTHVYVPAEQKAVLHTGSDDGLKVFLNGQAIVSEKGPRGNEIGTDKTEVTLKQGWNALMLKVTNGASDWGANARLLGSDGNPIPGLKVSSRPQ